MTTLSAGDIMTRAIITLSPSTDIFTAMRTLLKRKISGAPVIDENRSLVGILSEKDCLRILTAEAFHGFPEGSVADYMTQSVQTVGPRTSIYDVVGRFLRAPYRRLPVIDDEGRLVGQISRRDALLAIESMRDNSYLYGQKEQKLPEDQPGVHSAMSRARQI